MNLEEYGQRQVWEFMRRELFSVSPDEELSSVAQLLRRERIHRVLVIERSKLGGIISTHDLVGLLENRSAVRVLSDYLETVESE